MIADFCDRVMQEDVFCLLARLPDNSVDMVYGDPDYNIGLKYGDKRYTKAFDEYIEWYICLARESLRVLKKDGNMFLMNYPKQNAHLRVKFLDNACYEVLDYSWVFHRNVGCSRRHFTIAHRSILHCMKTKNNKFYKNNVAQPYYHYGDKRVKRMVAGGSKGRMPYDWFYFDMVKGNSKEGKGHVCPVPMKLSEMLIKVCTSSGDIVLILFGGSGSEIEVCKYNDRHFISAEINGEYCEKINKRLEKIGRCRIK